MEIFKMGILAEEEGGGGEKRKRKEIVEASIIPGHNGGSYRNVLASKSGRTRSYKFPLPSSSHLFDFERSRSEQQYP